MQDFWNDIFQKTNNIYQIPSKFITTKMIIEYFKTDDVKKIDKNLLTKELIDNYLIKNPKYYSLNIPSHLITKQMYLNYFNETTNIKDIPEKYLTQEMCNKYFEKYKNTQFIPEHFLTQEMYENYFYRTLKINKIPKKFITQNMVDHFYKITNSIQEIPDNFLTKEFIQKYFDENYQKNKNIFFKKGYLIPFITQEMCDKYFDYYKEINFPQIYISDKMNLFLFENKKYNQMENVSKDILNKFCEIDFKLIPTNFLSYNFCTKYFNETKNIKDIPHKYLTQKMCNEYFEKTQSIENIPEHFLTQEMINNANITNLNINSIPFKFMNQNIYQKYFDFHKNIHQKYLKQDISYKELSLFQKFVDTDQIKKIKENNYDSSDSEYDKKSDDSYECCKDHENSDSDISCSETKRKTRYFRFIDFPEKFKTEQMYIYLFENDQIEFDYIKKVTNNIIKIYIDKYDIDDLPEKYLSQEICDYYFEKNNSIINIPPKFISQNMIDKIKIKI